MAERAQSERVEALLDELSAQARLADMRPICWIAHGDDAGRDYCPDCARWVAKHLRRRRLHREACADGGWDDARESDGPAFCSGCGHPLGYTLTGAGLQDELAYWTGDAWSEVLSPVHAYAVEALLQAAYDIGDDEEIAEAIAVGERAVLLLPAPQLGEVLHG